MRRRRVVVVFFTKMAAFAELERDIIHERTMTGLAAARALGRVSDRSVVTGPDRLAAARARRQNSENPTRIAKGSRRQLDVGMPAPGREHVVVLGKSDDI